MTEVLVADLAKAVKSALVFAGDDDLFLRYAYVRFDQEGDHLYLTAGDKYQVGSVRVEAEGEELPDRLFLTAESLKRALVWLKPGRTKPTVQLRVGVLTGLFRPDTKETFFLDHCDEPSPLPPVFPEPYSPIDWDRLGPELGGRFAVSPELITKVARAAWNNTDAVIVEPGGTPHSPLTFRIGTYLVAILAPKDGRNGNETTNAPNAEATRRSWHQALQAMKLTRNALQGVDPGHHVPGPRTTTSDDHGDDLGES